MTRHRFVATYRLAGALLIVAAAVDNLVVKWDQPGFRLVNFFSYFTVLSNLFAAGVLALGATRLGRVLSERWELLRGAAVLYMVVTGIVYALLLSGYDNLANATPGFTNWVMHRIMPVVVAADWLYVPPARTLRFRHALAWLAFPLVYLGYTLIRGPIADWYPYPFVDPTRSGGYARVAAWCAVLTLVFVALTWAVTWVGNCGQDRPARH